MEEKMYDSRKARKLLDELGIQPYLRGYQITLLALECISEDENCLSAVIKEVYLPIAELLKCDTATVEAAIRRTSEKAWKNCPQLLSELSGKKLDSRPQVRIFLLLLYNACCKTE